MAAGGTAIALRRPAGGRNMSGTRNSPTFRQRSDAAPGPACGGREDNE